MTKVWKLVSVAAVTGLVVATAWAQDKPDTADWTSTKQHREAVVKKGTPIHIVNHFGDVRVRRMKDTRVAVFAIVQTPPSSDHVLGVSLNPDSGVVAVGGPTDELLAHGLIDGVSKAGRADLTVFLPEHSPVHIETLHGLIRCTGVEKRISAQTDSGPVLLSASGDVQVATRSGPVELLLKRCGRGQSIGVETDSGSVVVRFPRPADAVLTAEMGGALQTDFSVSVAQTVTSSIKKIKARVSEGKRGPRGLLGRLWKRITAPPGVAGRVKIVTHSGNVELHRAPRAWRRPERKERR